MALQQKVICRLPPTHTNNLIYICHLDPVKDAFYHSLSPFVAMTYWCLLSQLLNHFVIYSLGYFSHFLSEHLISKVSGRVLAY